MYTTLNPCNYLRSLSIYQKVRIFKGLLFAISLLSLASGLKGNASLANRRVVAGTIGCLIAPCIKVINQRCNLITSSKKIATGAKSLILNLFHLTAYGLARKTGFSNPASHLDAASFYAERGYNAFYQLIGSDRIVINLPGSAVVLVKTENRVIEELNNEKGLREIAEEAQTLLEGQSDTPIDFHLEEEISLEKGVCQGMTQVFIFAYQKGRSDGLEFEEAAIKAAEPLHEGGTLLASALQWIHMAGKVNETKFDRVYPEEAYSEHVRDTIRANATAFFGHQLLGNVSITVGAHDFSTPRQFAQLGDGVYAISVGWKRVSDETSSWVEKEHGHAMALLVEDGAFLIFDPNRGLFRHPDPDRYFEVQNGDDNGFAAFLDVKPV